MSVKRSTPECSTSERSTPLPPDIMDLIARKAEYLAATYRFTVDDLDDLKQDLTLEVLRRRTEATEEDKQDEDFLKRAAYHAVAGLVRHRSAAKRDYRRETRLLDHLIPDEEDRLISLMDVLADTGRDNSEAMTDLRLELKAVISKLPRRTVPIFRHFLLGRNISEIARHLKRPRYRIYDDIFVIRKRFQEAGLELYFENRPDSFPRFSVMGMGRASLCLPRGKRI